MDLKLQRIEYRADGIFSELKNARTLEVVAHCLEHAYSEDGGATFNAKLPPGTYTCVRGPHRLHGMVADFITFEIMNVPGHSGILFHVGNFNKDSDGCVLVGEGISSPEPAQGSLGQIITNSKVAFADFMKKQDGIDSFQLIVID